MIAGLSATLKNSVFFGEIEALEDSTIRRSMKPIMDKQDKYGIGFSEYILKPTNPGRYSLTGVISKIVHGRKKLLPFEYNYVVKNK